jgi:hypothetical protein
MNIGAFPYEQVKQSKTSLSNYKETNAYVA